MVVVQIMQIFKIHTKAHLRLKTVTQDANSFIGVETLYLVVLISVIHTVLDVHNGQININIITIIQCK